MKLNDAEAVHQIIEGLYWGACVDMEQVAKGLNYLALKLGYDATKLLWSDEQWNEYELSLS